MKPTNKMNINELLEEKEALEKKEKKNNQEKASLCRSCLWSSIGSSGVSWIRDAAEAWRQLPWQIFEGSLAIWLTAVL